MSREAVNQAINLSQRVGHVFVATADPSGLPHVAASRKITLLEDGTRVAVEDWFCPTTVANVHQNHTVALVVWDPAGDVGYQLLGEMEKIEDMAVMNGYAPAVEYALPQVERRLIIRVTKVIDFSHAPHSDEEK